MQEVNALYWPREGEMRDLMEEREKYPTRKVNSVLRWDLLTVIKLS